MTVETYIFSQIFINIITFKRGIYIYDFASLKKNNYHFCFNMKIMCSWMIRYKKEVVLYEQGYNKDAALVAQAGILHARREGCV